MLIKEGLKNYYSTLPLIFGIVNQKELNKKLKEDIKTLGDTIPGYKTLWNLINNYDVSFHPDSAVKICNSLGCETYDKLGKWVLDPNIIELNNVLELKVNTLELPELTQITMNELKTRIDSIPNLANDVEITYADTTYQVVPESEFKYILESFDGSRYEYIPEQCDCDDFSRIFRGWLSKQNYGNITIGKCWYKGFDKDDKMVIYHSVIAIVTDENIYGAEPQSKLRYWKIEEPSGEFWSKGVVRTEISRLEF